MQRIVPGVGNLPSERGHKSAITHMQVLNCAIVSEVGKKKVTECLVGDSTGSILFKARGKEAEEMTSGRSLRIKGCKVDMFRGSMRLVGHANVELEEISDVSAKVCPPSGYLICSTPNIVHELHCQSPRKSTIMTSGDYNQRFLYHKPH
jgi:hypothetical protein